MSLPTPTTRSLSISYRKFAAALIGIGLLCALFGYSLGAFLIHTQNTAALSSSQWSPAGSLNAPRAFSAFTTLNNGSVLVAGGFAGAVSPSLISSAELYNPNTNEWTMIAPMHEARAGALAVTLSSGEVLVTGGLGTSGVLTSCELYKPASNTWTMTGNMTHPRFDHQIILLNDGRVFVVGGDFGGTENNVTETYDPSTGAWRTDAPQPLARADMIAVKLPNGNVLVAGGHTSKVETLLSAVYNPAADNWTETGPLNTPHGDAGGVLLNNTAVLIVGGYTTYNDADNTIQYLYTPVHYGKDLLSSVRRVTSRVDATFDAAGKGGLQDAITLTGGTDRVITLADEHSAQLGVRFSVGTPDRAPDAVEIGMKLLSSGQLRLRQHQSLPMSAAAEAHRLLEEGKVHHKLLLTTGVITR